MQYIHMTKRITKSRKERSRRSRRRRRRGSGSRRSSRRRSRLRGRHRGRHRSRKRRAGARDTEVFIPASLSQKKLDALHQVAKNSGTFKNKLYFPRGETIATPYTKNMEKILDRWIDQILKQEKSGKRNVPDALDDLEKVLQKRGLSIAIPGFFGDPVTAPEQVDEVAASIKRCYKQILHAKIIENSKFIDTSALQCMALAAFILAAKVILHFDAISESADYAALPPSSAAGVPESRELRKLQKEGVRVPEATHTDEKTGSPVLRVGILEHYLALTPRDRRCTVKKLQEMEADMLKTEGWTSCYEEQFRYRFGDITATVKSGLDGPTRKELKAKRRVIELDRGAHQFEQAELAATNRRAAREAEAGRQEQHLDFASARREQQALDLAPRVHRPAGVVPLEADLRRAAVQRQLAVARDLAARDFAARDLAATAGQISEARSKRLTLKELEELDQLGELAKDLTDSPDVLAELEKLIRLLAYGTRRTSRVTEIKKQKELVFHLAEAALEKKARARSAAAGESVA